MITRSKIVTPKERTARLPSNKISLRRGWNKSVIGGTLKQSYCSRAVSNEIENRTEIFARNCAAYPATSWESKRGVGSPGLPRRSTRSCLHLELRVSFSRPFTESGLIWLDVARPVRVRGYTTKAAGQSPPPPVASVAITRGDRAWRLVSYIIVLPPSFALSSPLPARLFSHFRRKKEVNTDPRIPRSHLVLSRLLWPNARGRDGTYHLTPWLRATAAGRLKGLSRKNNNGGEKRPGSSGAPARGVIPDPVTRSTADVTVR